MGEHQIPPRFDHGAAYAQGVRSLATWRQIQEIAARCLAAHMRGERVVLTANGQVLAEIDPPQVDGLMQHGSNTKSILKKDGDEMEKRMDDFGSRLLGASVGDVDRRQGGILETRARVTDEMVQRALREGERWGNPLGGAAIRAMLEAALRG
ncbi:hypothetical protein [Methylobacterium aquaticum]|uniref:Uncharacterized protein n=1 Tax=Methylobacterium aquaticum TaxID=270351 RepID=A0A0C6FCA9_9HYPH|nr:hypothetical protein [Methylobacterium aquaticum]BAQ50306.1 hypothetical protein Maq22A_3p50275 [Methylobacterium aquaticum]